MATAQPWSPTAIAAVNRQLCYTEAELQQKLKQIIPRKPSSVEIEIYDSAAQRSFLPLAVYSANELLPQAVGSLVGKMGQASVQRTNSRAGSQTKNLELVLAITSVMNESRSWIAKVIAAAMLSGLNEGYRNISFGTNPGGSYVGATSGAVVLWMQA